MARLLFKPHTQIMKLHWVENQRVSSDALRIPVAIVLN
jgi:hypothetical protein